MATRPIVPRANGEGSLGVSTKSWGGVFANELNGANAVDMADFSKATLRQPSTAYAVGAMAYHATLPTGWFLECTTAGISGSGTLTITSPTVGGTVSDGTVTWTVRKNASTQDLTGYLPLSGGAMTGSIIERSANNAELYIVGGNVNTSGVEIPGARLALMGMDRTGDSGDFFLQAYNKATKTIKQLHGESTGNLSWMGNSLNKSAVVAESLGANGYRKYASGLIVQWGLTQANGTIPSGGDAYKKEVTLNIAFSDTYKSHGFASYADGGYAGWAQAYIKDTSTIVLTSNKFGSTQIHWYAIGY